MCLAIASHNTQLTTAPEALLTPAAAKGDGANGALGPPRMLSTEVAAHARRIFFDFGGRPTLVDPGYPTQAGSSGQNDRRYAFSGRHDGMALYLARLVQPFWNEKVTRKVPTRTEPERQVSNLSERMIVNAQRDLNLLQQFLNQNGQLFTLAGPQGLRGNAGAAEDEQAMYRAEQASLNALRTLLSQALEALSFVQLLIDHRLSNIIAACPPALQKQLLDLTYADLLTTRAGRDAARGLVAAVIDAQIGAQMGIDAVADMLQARCGSFCSADDVRLYKAIECIRRAKEARDERERVESLRESARLLGKATTQLPLEKLQEICKEYENMRFATGM